MHKAVSDTKPIGDLLLRDFFFPAITFADFYGIIPKVTKQERTTLHRVARIITQVNHHHKVGLDVSKLQTKMEELFHIAANLQQPATLVKKKRRYENYKFLTNIELFAHQWLEKVRHQMRYLVQDQTLLVQD